ncbi:thiol-disulfide oxidoreductase DCC family protein [Phycicoccus jejuensis]|uniref:thiol-disulfide oxidoreductase DCC family protein n=1 Tax=Phycicoccus jejuensis TaxID=367299 RepID=UPI000B00E8DD|nr:DCC1-like thiol-disulfide oxidoreductase family protein [Phycicoccus jejuensis]
MPAPVTPRLPVLLFDGDCAFCSSSVRLLLRLRRSPADYAVEPWQQVDLGPLGVTEQACTEAVQWVAADGRVSSAQDAVARALLASRPWVRPLGALVLVPGVRQVARAIYFWVARNRHRLPGGTPACSV